MSHTNDKIAYYISLNRIPGIGAKTARQIIAKLGNIEDVFKLSIKDIKQIDGIGPKLAQNIIEHRNLDIGMRELEFIHKSKIQATSFYDDNYPQRLKNCDDAPLLLFSKGNFDWNAERMVSIVGTRKASSYGQAITEKLISDMASRGNYTVVSGLAYGIDTIAHRACLKHDVPTVGVLAHGLDTIYPAKHRDTAKAMLANGGLITEFSSGTAMHANNFLSRNRIVAGLADCTIIIESAAKGGSLITAYIANSYNRDVFAFPGRCNDKYSVGCNNLIKRNQAALIQSIEDIEYVMNWDENNKTKAPAQRELFVELSEEEQHLVNCMSNEPIFIDTLSSKAKLPTSKTLSLLFSLEFKGMVRSHVGKMYSLI